MDSRIVGVLGGGQLGRMMVNAGNRIGVRMSVLDPGGGSSSAGQISHFVIEGSFTDSDCITELSKETDLITTEIEHVDTRTLEVLEQSGTVVRPNAKTLAIIQDKFKQKSLFKSKNISQPEFVDVPTIDSARDAGYEFGYPFMLKCKRLAYDGKGNAVVNSTDDLERVFTSLNGGSDLYAEQMVSFTKELAIMVVRTEDSRLLSYSVVETVQVDNVCRLVIAPAQISKVVSSAALALAIDAVSCFDGVGIYGVEMFLLHDESVLLNEIAPRPHNSGHYTIEACDVDQFEMHLRAVLGLPCPQPRMRVPFAAMLNILGVDGDMQKVTDDLKAAAAVSGCTVHWYGKTECRAGRKMAHITVTADCVSALRERLEMLGVSSQMHGLPAAGPRVGIVMGSDSDLSTMKGAAEVLDAFGVQYELTIVSAHRTPNRMFTYGQTAVERGLEVIVAGAGGAAHLPGMLAALTTLPVIGVPVSSATFGGIDALLSIVQMPRGVPVATVAIGNAMNAGLLALRILACRDALLTSRLEAFATTQEEEVLEKADRLETVGYKQYLSEMSK